MNLLIKDNIFIKSNFICTIGCVILSIFYVNGFILAVLDTLLLALLAILIIDIKNLKVIGIVLLLEYIMNKIVRFHRNQKGMQTLEVLIIVALSAIVAVAIYGLGKYILDFAWECMTGVIK